jgi:hypothetical protein
MTQEEECWSRLHDLIIIYGKVSIEVAYRGIEHGKEKEKEYDKPWTLVCGFADSTNEVLVTMGVSMEDVIRQTK